jgi:hypothetical protein
MIAPNTPRAVPAPAMRTPARSPGHNSAGVGVGERNPLLCGLRKPHPNSQLVFLPKPQDPLVREVDPSDLLLDIAIPCSMAAYGSPSRCDYSKHGRLQR